MAIKNNFTAFGVVFTDAYTRITNVEYSNGLQEKWEMSEDTEVPPVKIWEKILRVKYSRKTYANAEQEQPIAVGEEHFVIDAEGAADIVGACYSHLKSLPEFENCIDS